MMNSPIALTAACLLFVIALLVVDRLQWPLARAFTKLGASTCFVWLAIVLGAMQSRYGQWVLGALVLGWLGDALLLGKRSAAFMAGLVAFLLSHGLYATAFVSGPLNGPAMAVALVAACAAGVVVLRWLRPHTPAPFKAPVLVYVVVILSMCVAAVGHAVATGRWIVLGGGGAVRHLRHRGGTGALRASVAGESPVGMADVLCGAGVVGVVCRDALTRTVQIPHSRVNGQARQRAAGAFGRWCRSTQTKATALIPSYEE